LPTAAFFIASQFKHCYKNYPKIKKRRRHMGKRKKLMRKAWTTEGLRRLKVHSERGTPIGDISREMQRTIAALRQQAYRMRIPLGERSNHH
jgi:hypothetical protein